VKTLFPKDVHNIFYGAAGALFLVLNCLRHRIRGYKKPRPFSVFEFERSLSYDFEVVEGWMRSYREYAPERASVEGKTVLELGPGPDLGIGLILLAMGAAKYIAMDAHPLAFRTPRGFYDLLFVRLKERFPSADIAELERQLDGCLAGSPQRLVYVVDPKFRIGQLRDEVDVVFSQAAFEHFADVDGAIAGLTKVARPGGDLVAVVDLQTHSGWLRERDPLSIYRYGEGFWKTWRFSGSPNRVRMPDYVRILQRHGWLDVGAVPLVVLDEEYTRRVLPSLDPAFRLLGVCEMKNLSVSLAARRGRPPG
jgi:SAM-dependent methyltransferase